MIRRVRFSICLLALYLLQVAVAPRFSYGPLRIDLLTLLAAFLALEANFTGAVVGVFVVGLVRDLGAEGRLGGSALLFLLTLPPLWMLREFLLRENPLTDWLLTAGWVAAIALVTGLVKALVTPHPQAGPLLVATGGQALMTALVAPLVFVLLHKAGITATDAHAFGPE